MLASFVQQVCFQPPMVSIAVAKGRPIMPLISESRCFGICQLPKGDKINMRKFAAGIGPNDDPFLGFQLRDNCNNVPILANIMSYLICNLSCHMDVEGDHDLFIGTVIAGEYLAGDPEVRLRENGFSY